MTPIESAALRSSILAAAAFVLFVLASFALYPAPDDEKLRVFSAFTDPASLATLVVCCAGLFALQIRSRTVPPPQSPMMRLAWAAFAVLLISAAIVALYACMTAAFQGGFWQSQASASYQVRMFGAAVFAVAVVRIALPLLTRFDRMSPRSS